MSKQTTMTETILKNSEVLDELNWVRIQNENIKTESFTEKFKRKVKENPTVPIGITATTAALTYGLWSFYRGNSIMSQMMMRARVAAQGFTILSMAIGFIITSGRQKM